MESGINYLISHAFCQNCSYKWTAVVEVEYIQLTENKEYKMPEFLECPECKSQFADYSGIITDEEFKNKYFKK
jgi:hypothetical protein